MVKMTQLHHGFRLAHRVTSAVLAVYLTVAILLSGFMALFFLLSVIGGAVVATVLLALNAKHRPIVAVNDSFTRDAFFTEMLNFAHVRVSGVGGVGLLLVTGAITIQFPLLRAVVFAGVVGGILGGAALILYRRHHPPASIAYPLGVL